MSYEIPLVLEIQKRPCLYNYNLPEYNRKDTLDKVWAEISAAVCLSVYECKDKWKNIRSSFVRSLRYHGGKLKKPYYLSQYLQFLLPYVKPTNTDDEPLSYTNEALHEELKETLTIKLEPRENREQIDPLDNDIIVENKITPLKSIGSHELKRHRQQRSLSAIRHQTLQQRNRIRRQHAVSSRENNAMKYFLLSLLPELDALTENQIRLFKIKVMMLIDEIKSDESQVRGDLPSLSENTTLQRRLINLLLKNLEKGLET